MLSWTQLVECVDDSKNYIDAVNSRQPQTGFGWNDILDFAALEKEYAESQNFPVEQLRTATIISFGDYTEGEARAQAEELLGNKANGLTVVNRSPGFANTWALDDGSISDYYHSSQQVRVSLMPIKKMGDGAIVVDNDARAGVFVDCLNIWWQPSRVWVCSDDECTPPAKETPPPTPPAGTIPPPPDTTPPPPTETTPPTPSDGKGTANPDSQNGFNGQVTDRGEPTAPSGPSVSDGNGSRNTKPADSSTPGSSHGSAQVPGSGGAGSGSGGGSTDPLPPDGGEVVGPDESGTTPGRGDNPIVDPGDGNKGIGDPDD